MTFRIISPALLKPSSRAQCLKTDADKNSRNHSIKPEPAYCIHLMGDKVSVSFQTLKVTGGVLSAGAGFYSMVLDWDKANNAQNKERYALAATYRWKSRLQFASTTLGLLASVSYAAPLMEASSSKIVQSVGGRLLYYRLFCMTWAVRINMVGLAITFFIWKFTDDALQGWCEECPFGIKKDRGSKNPENLLKSYGEALVEVF